VIVRARIVPNLARRDPMRSIRSCSWPLCVAAVLAACPPKVATGPAVAGCDFPAGFKAVAPMAMRTCAIAAKPLMDPRHGVGDAQRLALPGARPGELTYGPYVEVAPLRNYAGASSVTALSDSQLARSVPLAIVTAKGPYAKLGIQPGVNALIVRVAPGDTAGTAAMVSVDSGTVTMLAVHVQEHKDPADQPLATARWLWSDNDESLWVACGRRCCWVTPLPQLQ
jgi:hypothetical protein